MVSMARVIEKSGRSVEEAIVIVDVTDEKDGIAAEFRYLAQRFGEEGKNWTLIQQNVVERSPGALYDVIIIAFPDGRLETLYFDIRSFFPLE